MFMKAKAQMALRQLIFIHNRSYEADWEALHE